MNYIRKHLMTGETVVCETRLSRIMFLPAFLLVVLAGLIFSAIMAGGPEARRALPLPEVILACAVALALWVSVKRSAVEFAVTNKRVIVKTGLVGQHSSETLLRQVEGITVDQGIFGRVFNYGTIVIEGTGTDRIPYPGIMAPMQFRMAALEQIDKATAPAAAMPHDAEPNKDPYLILLRMNALKERGIMTDEEFQREKSKILGRA
jgi:uncharacterized membrane protein YdbT with pleckstrin-like domain